MQTLYEQFVHGYNLCISAFLVKRMNLNDKKKKKNSRNNNNYLSNFGGLFRCEIPTTVLLPSIIIRPVSGPKSDFRTTGTRLRYES